MKMNKYLYNAFFLCMLCLSANAQKEMRWENVTALHFAATNGTDKDHALQQYLLFDEAVLDRNRGLLNQYHAFAEEFLNQSVPEGLKVIDQTIADFKKKIKENPDMAETLKESIRQMEDAKKQFAEEYGGGTTGYTYDPATLFQNLTQIAVNKKVYTGYKDINGGLFAVKTGFCYGPLEPSTFNPVKTDEQDKYSWGVIDYNGHYVIQPIYGEFYNMLDKDIIFLQTKDKSGTVRAGACGYNGRVRIPFVYDYRADLGFGENFCIMVKGGKFGFVDFDGKVLQPCEFGKPEYFAYGWSVSKDGKNYGVIDYREGKLVIPLKYKCYWDCGNGEIQMQRHDRKLDVYDKTFKFVRTDNAPKN